AAPTIMRLIERVSPMASLLAFETVNLGTSYEGTSVFYAALRKQLNRFESRLSQMRSMIAFSRRAGL
ncbi:MAG: hypothetical protein WAU86_20575, partial [Oricola sp.]